MTRGGDPLPAAYDDLVRQTAAPLADAANLDLVDVEVKGEGPRRLVRVIVDRRGGVDVDACQNLSQRLGARLDELSELDDGYVLEVTSPGVDHPLRDRRAFDRVQGRAVLVHRRRDDGRLEQVRGTVQVAGDDAVVLSVEGATVRIGYPEIAKATQSLPW